MSIGGGGVVGSKGIAPSSSVSDFGQPATATTNTTSDTNNKLATNFLYTETILSPTVNTCNQRL